MNIFLPALAVFLDKIIGDPRSSYHPVVLIGNMIAFGEKRLLRVKSSGGKQFVCGVVLVLLVLSITYCVVWYIMQALTLVHPWLAFVAGGLLLSFTISPRSLAEAGNEIKGYLENNDLAQARFKVGWIVGRDTDQLDSSEITRATVETVAENIVDGIISPLFYWALGGVPLAFLYRAVNTLDSMVGYKSDKYFYFGKCAARVDDVFNYIPARLTGLLIILAAAILRLHVVNSLRTILRDAAKHPSPNSGIAEAGVAGALGIRLGGINYYKGVKSVRAYMGNGKTTLSFIHIKQTIQIMYTTTILYLILALFAAWITGAGVVRV